MSGASVAPTVETERLILRAHTLDDFEDCAQMWSDPAVTQFIGGSGGSHRNSGGFKIFCTTCWSCHGCHPFRECGWQYYYIL